MAAPAGIFPDITVMCRHFLRGCLLVHFLSTAVGGSQVRAPVLLLLCVFDGSWRLDQDNPPEVLTREKFSHGLCDISLTKPGTDLASVSLEIKMISRCDPLILLGPQTHLLNPWGHPDGGERFPPGYVLIRGGNPRFAFQSSFLVALSSQGKVGLWFCLVSQRQTFPASVCSPA